MSTQRQFLFAAKYLIAVVALSHSSLAHAQFTTVINVPPESAPLSIGSDTQLNFNAGGDDLPASFQAGLSGDADNIEVNINGGTVGDMFNAGPTDGSGGDVSVNVTGGTLGSVTAYSGGEVAVSGGQLGMVSAEGGNVTSTTGSNATFESFGAFNGGKAVFDSGTVTGGENGVGGFLWVFQSTDSPELTINGGEMMGVSLTGDLSSPGKLTINGGRIVGDVNGNLSRNEGIDVTIAGGEITGDVRLDVASLSTTRITGGSLQTLVSGNLVQPASSTYPRVEILGGSIGNVDMTDGFAFVTYYGTQFAIDGSDVTGTLTPGVATDVGSGLDRLSGVLADGTVFDYDFPTQSGFTSLVLVGGNHGDFNDDTMVDAADLTVWEDNFGATGNLPYELGDGDGDGDTDGADFLVWQRQFGATFGDEADSSSQSLGVPEPSTCVLLLLAMPWIARYRTLGQRN